MESRDLSPGGRMLADVVDVSRICIAEYRFEDDRRTGAGFIKLPGDSLSFEYYSGVKLCTWVPHKDYDYRNLPFTAIAFLGECDAGYYAAVKDHGRMKVGKNCALVLPAGLSFKLELLETGLLSCAHILFTIFEHIDVLSLFEVPFIIEGETALEIGALINSLAVCNNSLAEADSVNIFSLAAMKSYAYGLLCSILSKSTRLPESGKSLVSIQKISAVLNYMTAHIGEKISRKTLAGLMFLSETRFHYVFTEIMGVPPMDYLMRLRMKKAQYLLISTGKPVTEIADEAGIGDVFHFSKQFKLYNGMSPLKYRQSHVVWASHSEQK
jgi:AraC-like DNA-binding protein